MRPFSFVPLALACALSTPAAAQTGSEPNLVFTIFGGAVTGHPLWTVDKQPLCVYANTPLGGCTGQYDTVRLSREVGASLVLGVAATYFPWPHIGFHAEVSYLGLPFDDSCTGLYYSADSVQKDQQICNDIQAAAGSGGAISLFTGVTLRAATRRAFSPYVRGSIGIVNQASSTIETSGAYVDGSGNIQVKLIVADPKPRHTSLMLGAAAGFTSPLSPGYQFRFELRDVMVSLDRLTGPVNGLGSGPIAARSYHHIGLTLGLDVILERKRGRRY